MEPVTAIGLVALAAFLVGIFLGDRVPRWVTVVLVILWIGGALWVAHLERPELPPSSDWAADESRW